MQSIFDRAVDRRGSGSVKWDRADKNFGGTDLLPMWIADMDFPSPPGVLAALRQRVEQGIFGYSVLTGAYYEAVIDWMARRHQCEVKREWIVFAPGVVSALNFAVQAVTEPGDEVMISTPVYAPFYRAVEEWGRVVNRCPLKRSDGRYTFDFEEMERRITPRTRALMLCSPHNPVGRVWTREELEALGRFCLRHDLMVIADEIHSDLVFQPHTVFWNALPEMAQRTILCTAPSKTFNLAGIQASNIIIPNEELRRRYRSVAERHHALSPNAFVEAAVVGAYRDSEAWLDELLVYLKGNVDYFCAEVARSLPKLRVLPPEGTYLAWVDCSGLGLSPEERQRFLVEKCKVAFNDGSSFGPEGADFVRVNLACPRSTVEECLQRLRTGGC